MLERLRSGRLHRPSSAAPAVGGITQLHHGDPVGRRMTGTAVRGAHEGRHPTARPRRRPQRLRPRRRLPVRARRRRAGRPRRGGSGAASRRCSASWRPSSATTTSGSPGCGPDRLRCAAVPARRTRTSSSSRPSSSARVRDGTAGSPRSTAPRPTWSRPGHRPPDAGCVQRRAPACRSRPTWLPSSAGRDAVRAGRLTKVVHRPRRRWSRPTARSTSTPSSCGCGPRSARATGTPSDGFVGASPELLVARHGDVVRSHPLAGTAPRTGDPDDGRPSPPPRSSRPPRTRSSTGSSSTSCTRRCCRGAATSTGRPSRRSSPWPTCSTSARLIEGRLSSPAAERPRAGRRRSPRPRRSAAIPAPRPWS